MRSESITWHELPQDGMPDADLTVLISTEHQGVESGWFDGLAWRWCESGGLVGEPVQGWAEIPRGIVPDAATVDSVELQTLSGRASAILADLAAVGSGPLGRLRTQQAAGKAFKLLRELVALAPEPDDSDAS